MRLVIMKDLTFTGDEPAVKTHRPRIDSTRDFQSEALNFEVVPDFHVIRDDVVSGMELSCLGVNISETSPRQGLCNVCFVDDDNTCVDSKTKVDLEQLQTFCNNNNNNDGSINQDNVSGICIPNSTTPHTCSENNTIDSDISNPGCSNYNCDANKNNKNDIRRRHENGHLLLGHSVSSYIDLHPHGLFNPLEPAPNDEDKPGQQLDSGICSEATSAVEHFNNVNDDAELTRSASESSLQLSLALEQCKDVFLNALRLQEMSRLNSLPPATNEIHNHELNRNEILSKSSLNAICVYPQVTILTQVKEPQSSTDPEKAQPLHVERHGSYQKRDSVPDDRRFPPNRKLERGISKQKRKKNNERLIKNEACRETLCAKYTSCRWVLAYMCFLARFVQTALRQCMGIAVVGMTLKTTTVVQKSENSTQENSNFTSQNSSTNISFDGLVTFNETLTHQEFEWSSVFEGILLASFNIGSIITPIIVGYLTTRYGGRALMTSCLVCAGVFTVLLPVSAGVHPSLIIASRVVTGIAVSGTDSLVQAMWAKWAPRYETASLSSCSYTGLSVAGVLTFLVCGYLTSIGGDGKAWPYIFYVFGSLCLILAPLWWYTVYDNPDVHPRITKKELAIITFNKKSEDFYDKSPLNTPWKRILKSPAVWVVLMGHISNKWILSFMLSYLPRYFSDFFDFSLETDGLLSSLPFVGRIISGLIAGYMSDWMIRKGLSICRTRKLFQTIGCWGCAVFSLFIALIPGLNSSASIALLVLALSFQNLTTVAFRINLLDIAPRYAGLLNGVVSTVATLISLPAPVVTSLLIAGGSRDGWLVVFCLVAGFNIVGGLIFVLFAQGDIQDWAKSDYSVTVVQREVTPDQGKQPDVEKGIFVTESSTRPLPLNLPVVNGKPLREVKSVPASLRRGSKRLKQVARRASMDVGWLIKNVQNQAFSNLALADL